MRFKERLTRLESLASGSELDKPSRVILCRDEEELRAAQIEAENNPTEFHYLLEVRDYRKRAQAFNA